MERQLPNGAVMKAVTGDITAIPADAIVNAANSGLVGGGGVDGAIHRAAGPALMRELDEIRPKTGGCPTGGAVATGAGKLPAKYVFHAVGPVYRDGQHGEADLLRSCYETCMRMADERAVETISFPAISTGVYGYPVEDAARIAVSAVARYLERGESGVREVIFALFGDQQQQAYERAFGELDNRARGA
jgi:O-acetyl-ADP-ribose deacetylase (regulator of RNase III)